MDTDLIAAACVVCSNCFHKYCFPIKLNQLQYGIWRVKVLADQAHSSMHAVANKLHAKYIWKSKIIFHVYKHVQMKGMGPLMLEVSSNDSESWMVFKIIRKRELAKSFDGQSIEEMNWFEIFNGYQVYILIIYIVRAVIND